MEIKLDDVSGLPDALKPLAQEADGKFTLDLSKLGPASEIETWKGKAVTAQQESIDRRKALEAWKALGESPDAISAKLAKGADPAIIEQMRTQHAADLAARDSKLHGLLSRTATESLKAELAKAGVIPEGLDLLASFAGPRIQFDDDGVPRVLAEDGKTPMVGSGANGGATLADLAKQLAAKIPHLTADGGKGGGGKPPGNGGDGGVKSMSRAAFDALSPAGKAAAMAAKTILTD